MEEIALVFSSLAGACTAVAIDKIPRRRQKASVTISSAVENQLHSLRIEKEILTKTITRLHNDDSNVSGVQRDRLLTRYQHQLGTIVAKIEKMEIASRYPDLGPVGDSIISLMDTKLSKMDQRLHEISSKISANQVQQTVMPQPQPQAVQPPRQEPPRQIVHERPPAQKTEPRTEVLQEVVEAPKARLAEPAPPEEVKLPERHISVELSTLTAIPNKMPEFPAEFIKPAATVEIPKVAEAPEPVEVPKSVEIPKPDLPKKIDNSHQLVAVEPSPLATSEPPKIEIPKIEPVAAEVPKPEPAVEKKIQMPTPVRIPEEEAIEDDDKDLDKIKSEIMKALSKLEQVEVE